MKPDQKRQRRSRQAQRQKALETVKQINGRLWTLDRAIALQLHFNTNLDRDPRIVAQEDAKALKLRADLIRQRDEALAEYNMLG